MHRHFFIKISQNHDYIQTHCQSCNRDYSDNYFRKHRRSNIHLKKAFEVKYIYKKENILVNEIHNNLSNIIKKT